MSLMSRLYFLECTASVAFAITYSRIHDGPEVSGSLSKFVGWRSEKYSDL
jgi:hypothetical protein